SGFDVFNVPGWWSLVENVPPPPSQVFSQKKGSKEKNPKPASQKEAPKRKALKLADDRERGSEVRQRPEAITFPASNNSFPLPAENETETAARTLPWSREKRRLEPGEQIEPTSKNTALSRSEHFGDDNEEKAKKIASSMSTKVSPSDSVIVKKPDEVTESDVPVKDEEEDTKSLESDADASPPPSSPEREAPGLGEEDVFMLLQRLEKIPPPLPPTAARLRRRLIVMRQKRRMGMRTIDLNEYLTKTIDDPQWKPTPMRYEREEKRYTLTWDWRAVPAEISPSNDVERCLFERYR
ncbi:hypothetical protein HDU67_004089, partial [Dinochytrium kinnereticum]